MAKVMISIPDGLLRELDRTAKAEHKKRSEFIKDLLLRFLKGISAPKQPSPNLFQNLREYTFELEQGESAEGIIREMREQR